MLDGSQLLRLAEDATREDIDIATCHRDPNGLWPCVCDARASIMDNDLEIVWMVWEKASLKLWVYAPVHDKCGQRLTLQFSRRVR